WRSIGEAFEGTGRCAAQRVRLGPTRSPERRWVPDRAAITDNERPATGECIDEKCGRRRDRERVVCDRGFHCVDTELGIGMSGLDPIRTGHRASDLPTGLAA